MPAAATCPSSGAGSALAPRLAACWASQRWMASSTARRRRHQLTRWSPLLEKVHARDSGGVAVRMLRVRFRWARYQAASVARSAGGVSRSRRGTAWPLVTIFAIQPRMAPMWPTRSAAFQPGQSCRGRDQSDCATVRRSCPSAAVTVRISSSDTAVCLSLGAGTADKPVPGRQGGRATRSPRAVRDRLHALSLGAGASAAILVFIRALCGRCRQRRSRRERIASSQVR